MFNFNLEILHVEFYAAGEYDSAFKFVIGRTENNDTVLVCHRGSDGAFDMSIEDMNQVAQWAGVAASDVTVLCCCPGVNQADGGWVHCPANGDWMPCPVLGDWTAYSQITFRDGNGRKVNGVNAQVGAVYAVTYAAA